MSETRVLQRVLLIEDNAKFSSELREYFGYYNTGVIVNTPGANELVRTVQTYEFHVTIASDKEQIGEQLKGIPDYQVVIIDPEIGTEFLNIDILEVLRDLHVSALRIIWTAHHDINDLKKCILYGVHYYLNKGSYDTPVFLQVLESVLDGLERRRRMLLKSRIDEEGRLYVRDNFETLYEQYAGQFIAVSPNTNDWHVLAHNESLFSLYGALDHQRENSHVTFIEKLM